MSGPARPLDQLAKGDIYVTSDLRLRLVPGDPYRLVAEARFDGWRTDNDNWTELDSLLVAQGPEGWVPLHGQVPGGRWGRWLRTIARPEGVKLDCLEVLVSRTIQALHDRESLAWRMQRDLQDWRAERWAELAVQRQARIEQLEGELGQVADQRLVGEDPCAAASNPDEVTP